MTRPSSQLWTRSTNRDMGSVTVSCSSAASTALSTQHWMGQSRYSRFLQFRVFCESRISDAILTMALSSVIRNYNSAMFYFN